MQGAADEGGWVDAEKVMMLEAMARSVREGTGASLRVPFVASETTWTAFKHHLYESDPVAAHLLHSTWSSSSALKLLDRANKYLMFWRGRHEMSNDEFRSSLQDALASVGNSVAACMRKDAGGGLAVLEVEVFLCVQLCFEKGSGGVALGWEEIEECLRPKDDINQLQVLKIMTSARPRPADNKIAGLPSSYLFVKFKISANDVPPTGGSGAALEVGLPRGDPPKVTPPRAPGL